MGITLGTARRVCGQTLISTVVRVCSECSECGVCECVSCWVNRCSVYTSILYEVNLALEHVSNSLVMHYDV